LARRRCEIYEAKADFCQQNAERLAFSDGVFAHVNCIGVIHHTPNTEACLREIARVLDEDGTASISVYYRNIFLRAWPWFKGVGKLLTIMGAGMKGRGRENIFTIDDVNEIVRLYDGQDNPIGKAYTYEGFIQILTPYFYVEETYLYFFPARSLPIKLPQKIHRLLNNYVGFMICANVRKR
jgi:SAM-dependent methyltransferase